MHYYLATKQQKINLVTMTTASKIYTMVYKMVIFDENNKSIPHAKFYICKKVFFFENFDYRAALSGYGRGFDWRAYFVTVLLRVMEV